MRKFRTSIAFIAIAGMLCAGATPALATSPDGSEEGDIVAYVEDQKGNLIRLEDAVDTNLNLEPLDPADPGAITPRLIDWNQWFACFRLNKEDDIFGTYYFWLDDGTGGDVYLKCGYQNPDNANNGWGYKHILAGKEGLWQRELDNAISAGWVPSTQGVDSWDDLMHAGVGNALTFSSWFSGVKANNTRCAIGRLVFLEQPSQKQVYAFKTAAVAAMDSGRLITAYPISASTC